MSVFPPRLAALERELTECRRCPRLVAWREQVAREKRAAFASEDYWARPVPGFGDPAAHGGNRTGRVFTGDRSGDFLFGALHRVGIASQPRSTGPGDGMSLRGAFIAAAVRCAPPANRPTPAERDTCLPWTAGELELLSEVALILCLGAFAWDAALRLRTAQGLAAPRPRPRFGHDVLWEPGALGGPPLLGCFHPSQQNTFTGRLTPAMLDAVLKRAQRILRAR